MTAPPVRSEPPEPATAGGETPRRTLLVNGYVHTPEDPGATALLVEGKQIAWIGAEGATLARSDGVDRIIDLAGALVTPAFVDGHVGIGSAGPGADEVGTQDIEATLKQWSRVGVAAVHQFPVPGLRDSTLNLMLRVSESGDSPLLLWYRSVHAKAGGLSPGPIGIADVPAGGARAPGSVRAQVRAASALGLPAAFSARTTDELTEVLAGLVSTAEELGVDRLRLDRHRIELGIDPTEKQLAHFVELGLTASIQPFPTHEGGHTEPEAPQRLDRLAATGVPMVAGSGRSADPINPWELVRELVDPVAGGPGISARAAFAAHTRGGWRAIGDDHAGVLRTGAVASLVVWNCPELVVQQADEKISRWSTNPSSGTPLLPRLGAGLELPSCQLTMRAGHIIFDRGDR